MYANKANEVSFNVMRYPILSFVVIGYINSATFSLWKFTYILLFTYSILDFLHFFLFIHSSTYKLLNFKLKNYITAKYKFHNKFS